MSKKFRIAIPKRTEHVIAFRDFESALPEKTVKEWTTAIELWEQDNTQPNPFKAVVKSAFAVLFPFSDSR